LGPVCAAKKAHPRAKFPKLGLFGGWFWEFWWEIWKFWWENGVIDRKMGGFDRKMWFYILINVNFWWEKSIFLTDNEIFYTIISKSKDPKFTIKKTQIQQKPPIYYQTPIFTIKKPIFLSKKKHFHSKNPIFIVKNPSFTRHFPPKVPFSPIFPRNSYAVPNNRPDSQMRPKVSKVAGQPAATATKMVFLIVKYAFLIVKYAFLAFLIVNYRIFVVNYRKNGIFQYYRNGSFKKN
jgi:hypothetical protein